MKISTTFLLTTSALIFSSPAFAAPTTADTTLEVPVHKVDASGIHEQIGKITFADTEKGLKILPNLSKLSPGDHGFHLHTNPNCEPALKNDKPSAAEAAGGHYDPGHTTQHKGPEGAGHMGDLPLLHVEKDGTTKTAMNAPRLKVSDLHGRSIIIHEGGDNFSDSPKPLGGGGGRIACGIIH